jgi:hypothetical protein
MAKYEKYLGEVVSFKKGPMDDTEEQEPKLDMKALINLKLLAASVGLDDPASIQSLRKGIGRLENEIPLNWAQAGPLLKILRKILSSDKAKLNSLLNF